jgi:hypothetical protein
MKREDTKFCEECKNCEQIVRRYTDSYYIQCSNRRHVFDEPVIYCKYKKIKKEKK